MVIVLATATLAGVFATVLRVEPQWHLILPTVFSAVAVVTDGVQRRSILRLVIGLVLVVLGCVFFPALYYYGTPAVPGLVALVIFALRRDLVGATASLVVIGAGLVIRLVLSAGPIPWVVVLLAATIATLLTLAFVARGSKVAPPAR